MDVVIQPQDKIYQTAMDIGDVLSQMSLSRIKILILDACRTRIAGGKDLHRKVNTHDLNPKLVVKPYKTHCLLLSPMVVYN
ncbi:MAG: hypothetical protein HUU50_17855 [Candidatus Brocadiae bacterium]|nr:hypothetical protein [Candidatus Brocadiia bacterium]